MGILRRFFDGLNVGSLLSISAGAFVRLPVVVVAGASEGFSKVTKVGS